jgi:hypothetical protein
MFKSILKLVFHENVPLKRCPPKNSDNPWMNLEITRLIVERDIAYNIWDRNETDENRNRLVDLCKTVI